MPKDNDSAYYDSARAKVDRTDFASSQMPLHVPRRRRSGGGLLRILAWVVVAAVLFVVARRYLF